MRPAAAFRTVSATMILAIMAGCGEPSTAEVRLRADAETPAELDAARVTVSEGDRTRTFGRGDGVSTDAPGWRIPAFEVADEGQMTVTVKLAPDVAGSVTMDLREEFGWGVDVFRRADDPQEGCFGCRGGAGFPVPTGLQNETDERLWIVWGGRRPGSNVVF